MAKLKKAIICGQNKTLANYRANDTPEKPCLTSNLHTLLIVITWQDNN